MKTKNIISARFVAILIMLAFQIAANAQNYKLNFGLQQPQDPATLPIGKAEPQTVARKEKVKVTASFQKVGDNEFVISSGWEMAEAEKVTASEKSIFNPDFNTSDWYNATVPGTVLTTLVDQGVYPDPYYGLNNLYIPDSLSRKDWWYLVELQLPAEADGKIVWLLFNGINYKADIWLNGEMLGQLAGAFVRGQFNATKAINLKGENILAVHIYPPHNPGIPHEESSKTNHGPNGGQLCLDGPTFISSEGWDWVPGIRDRNIGIWQDVRVKITDAVTLSNPQVITDLPLPDTSKASITVKTMVTNHSKQQQNVTVQANIGSITFSKTISLKGGETRSAEFSPKEFPQLNLINPKLWWPNGYGRQEMYSLNLQAKLGNTASDQLETRFGVRELSYELALAKQENKMWRVEYNPLRSAGQIIFNTVDRVDVGKGTFLPKMAENSDPSLLTSIDENSNNPFLTIKVNGIPIFCRGGNWGMDDAMKRVSCERLEPYFRLHKEQNFNMIRNWTGESTEEVFYELADEYGMLVWNDFWLSTEGYNLNVNDNDLFMANATDVVKRFRNHPSIAIWCPRNEGYATELLEPRLQKLIAEEDGTRYYSSNSRNINLRPSGPWHYQKDPANYFNTIAEGFNSELGTPSIPTAETMRSFIPEADQWPISDTWYYHDFHEGLKPFVEELEKRYGEATSLEDFTRKAQFLNYESHRAMFESWNSKMWDNASGLLLWMSHPAWPSMVWQTYSWDYETFGSFFGSKKACEPLHIQLNPVNNQVDVINTTLTSYSNLQVKAEIYNLTGKRLSEQEKLTNIEANKRTAIFQVEFPNNLPNVYVLRLTLSRNNKIFSQNDYLRSDNGNFSEFNDFKNPEIAIKVIENENGKARFQLTNKGKVPALEVKLNLIDAETGKRILPAYFSDGYFNLLPGEKKEISSNWTLQSNELKLRIESFGGDLVIDL